MENEVKTPLPVTPGEAIVNRHGYPSSYEAWAFIEVYGSPTCGIWWPNGSEEQAANATLYADAHNTYNRVKLLPSELAEKLEEAQRLIAENRNRIWQAHQETYRSCGLSYERACKRADEATLPVDAFLQSITPEK